MSDTCDNGRIHDGNGYDRGICMVCNGAGCGWKKYIATYQYVYQLKFDAQSDDEARIRATSLARPGFSIVKVQEVKE